MRNTTYIIVAVLFLLLSIVSCTKDIDFTQGEDLEVNPVMETSLIYFNEAATSFNDIGVATAVVLTDEVVLNVFNTAFFVENVTQSDVVMALTNSINRGFEIRVQCLNNANQLQHQFSFSVPASPDNLPVETVHTEVFQGPTLNALKRTTKLVFTVEMQAGEPLTASSLGRIALRSKGVFYLTIEG